MSDDKFSDKEENISDGKGYLNNKNNLNLNQYDDQISAKDEILSFSENYGIQLKVPAISVVLSGLFPGLGQIYNGDSLLKGLLIFFGTAFGSFIFLIPGLVIWIYGMYDAWNKATGINSGHYDYKPAKTAELLLMVIIPLIVMIIFMLISIYAVMQLTEFPYELTSYLK